MLSCNIGNYLIQRQSERYIITQIIAPYFYFSNLTLTPLQGIKAPKTQQKTPKTCSGFAIPNKTNKVKPNKHFKEREVPSWYSIIPILYDSQFFITQAMFCE